jgi:hypothetical protein
MPDLLGVTRRLREIGRIRLGDSVPAKSRAGKDVKRPRKLDTFRLTSSDRVAIDIAAQHYGGAVETWDAPAGREFDLHSHAESLDIYLPPHEVALSQFFELWEGGGCVRRCDGQRELLHDGPCICATEEGERSCQPTSRLSVILAKLPGIGVWRLESHGYAAAAELPGTISLLDLLGVNGLYVPARLRIEKRSKLSGGVTRKFPVPVIDLDITPEQLSLDREQPGALTVGADAANPPEAPTAGPDAPPGPPTQQLAQSVERSQAAQLPQLAPDDELPPPPEPPAERDDDEDDPPPPVQGDETSTNPRMLQRVAMTCNDAGLTDDGRHSLCAAVTNGSKWSSKLLTIDEQQTAIRAAQRIKAGDWGLIPALDDEPPYLVERGPGWRIEPVSGAVDIDDARAVLRRKLDELAAQGEPIIDAWKAAKLGKIDVLPFERLYDAWRLVQAMEPF